MSNAELFKKIFGIYAEEFWAYPKEEMLNWINSDAPDTDAGDLISRRVAINLLKKWSDGYDYIETETESAIKDFQNLPPAQSERKKGKWIWMGDKGDSRFMCSVCKGKENVPTIMGKPTVWDYCPNCGAEMKGDRE